MICEKLKIGRSRSAIVAASKTKKLTPKNIFEEIRIKQHDEDFIPSPCRQACDASPGSKEKIEILCRRAEYGEELFHADDYVVHATVESSDEMRKWVADAIANSGGTAKHIRQKRDRLLAIKTIESSPDYVTLGLLRAELGVSNRACWKYLRNQPNAKYHRVHGRKYYLRSSLKPYAEVTRS